ncbi:S1 RNA-binding domain-containing protein [Acholeplasma granularum]|uniref:S1 RNA-binding domain-containing protein n=1 Tax=Acholeplasma granularum TaxID=264635 RepID=UPI00046E6C48|nr:S1 RNA-binding domain-containing protein [Acholeplasma granularum]
MKKDERILCKVTGIQPYGVFVEYENYQGLIHISEISDRFVADITKLFNVGDEIYAVVLECDQKNLKMQLSYKKGLLVDPKVLKKVDIKIGFRSLEEKLDEWVKNKKEDLGND